MRLTDEQNRSLQIYLEHGGEEHPILTIENYLDTIDALKQELTITLSAHAAQLQAACVELRRKAAHIAYKKQIPYGDEISKNYILAIPIPTAALETAIAEARLDVALEAQNRFNGFRTAHAYGSWIDSCVLELQAALDAAKAKVRE